MLEPEREMERGCRYFSLTSIQVSFQYVFLWAKRQFGDFIPYNLQNVQPKLVQDYISYKKLSGRIRLSSPEVKIQCYKDCHV